MAGIFGNRRAVLLIIATMVMAMVSVLTGVYLATLVTEKRSVDDQRLSFQAMSLGDAGLDHAMVELRKRVAVDLLAKVRSHTDGAYFNAYASNPLGFLRDHAYADGQTQFTVNGSAAQLSLTPYNLSGSVTGNYLLDYNGTVITATAPQAVYANTTLDVYKFYYSFSIESAANVTRGIPPRVVDGTTVYERPVSKRVVYAPQPLEIDVGRSNFAKYALFTSHQHYHPKDSPDSSTTVWFTNNTNFQGPVHTNSRFAFSGNLSAHFTEQVTQQDKEATYNNGILPSVSLDDDHNGVIDVPVFDKGFERSVSQIPLTPSITQDNLKTYALGTMADPGNGVWVANDGTKCVGGIYIRGNQGKDFDNPTIYMRVDGSSRQVYEITRSGSAYNITVDTAANKTYVTGAYIATFNGIPDGATHDGILVYVNDDIGSLYGTVQSGTRATVSSERDIVISHNLTYQSYTPSPLSATGTTNLLGIISWGGDVRIGTSAPDNVTVHGVIMAPHGVFGVDNHDDGDWPHLGDRGTATLLGGVITDHYGPFGTFYPSTTGYGRNFIYDGRMMTGSAPPYFPYMNTFESVLVPEDALYHKPLWREKDN